jgi:hypothetical protein
MKKLALLTVVIVVLFSGCVMNTMVTFNSDPDGAEVYLDNKFIGETPTQAKMSNLVWEESDVRMRAEGYRDAHFRVEKEIKSTNALVGFFLWMPSWLWAYGPEEHQYATLVEE